MTLAPEDRILLTDALRPPAGYRVDVAVGTTYSLDLTAILLAPLAFALFDVGESGSPLETDPIRLLEATRRHTEHTTMFCQAGAIYVPGNYSSIMMYIEDSIREVTAPNAGAIFHPKIWALRFTNPDGDRLHRIACLSRNMTMDRSWDTALVLDEDPDGTISAVPASGFVRKLPERCSKPMTGDRDLPRLKQVNDLADSLQSVRLAAPTPFTDGHLLPLGLSSVRSRPFPASARRLLAISPFLDKTSVTSISRVTEDRTIISRSESLDQVGSDTLDGWAVHVMQRIAEVYPDDDVAADRAAVTEFDQPGDGLHAKTYVFDLPGRQSSVITGSANLTRAGWAANVEFDVALSGPTALCGIAAVLDGSDESPGLGRLLEGYDVLDESGVDDDRIEMSGALDRFHQALAAGRPTLHVQPFDEDRASAELTLTLPDDLPGRTRAWLASLGYGQSQDLAETLSWTVAPINVTPFIAVETTVGEGSAQVTRRCVLVAELTGTMEDRRKQALSAFLRSKADVLLYLIFLLGDPSHDTLLEALSESGTSFNPFWNTPGAEEVALLEPLVRATGRDPDAIARVAGLVEELRSLPNGQELVPDGFDHLWDVVWRVHKESIT